MSGYDSVNRNVLSSVRKVTRDGADITSGGRQSHTWWTATENARLRMVKWWTPNEAVAAGRAESLVTWKVDNVGERAKVRRRTAMEHLVHQDGNFGPDMLRSMQPVKADEGIRDMVIATQVEN